MRAKTLTTPSDAPCPGIGWLVLPARDRIISQGERMGEGAFDLLKTGYSQPRSAKQPKITTADLARILSIGLSKPRAGRLGDSPSYVVWLIFR